MKILIGLCVFVVLYAQPSFSKSKKILKEIYSKHQKTFYCNIPYIYKGNQTILQNDGSYTPRNPTTGKGKPNVRTQRIEWEHIMPAKTLDDTCHAGEREGERRVNQIQLLQKWRQICTILFLALVSLMQIGAISATLKKKRI